MLTLGGAAGNPSLMTFEVGAAGADRVLLDAGKLVVNPGGAIISITALPGFGVGTYDLINFDSGQATGLDQLSLSSTSLDGLFAVASVNTHRGAAGGRSRSGAGGDWPGGARSLWPEPLNRRRRSWLASRRARHAGR